MRRHARKLADDLRVEYWMRGAEVRTARQNYLCDVAGCDREIVAGTSYAYVNDGIKACRMHFEPADIIEVRA